MSKLIDDRDEVEIVLQSMIARANLEELLEPLHPAEDAIQLVMASAADEEVAVALLNKDADVVATLYVDVLTDPVNGWTIKLRGWRLADEVASI